MSSNYFHNSPFALRIGPSQIGGSGFGVYTDEFIPASSCIDEYTGIEQTYGGNYALEIIENFIINGDTWPRSYMSMINDCTHVVKRYKKKGRRRIDKTPDGNYDSAGNKLTVNCAFHIDTAIKKAWVYSICDIHPGSELFISYGSSYWK